MEQSINLPLSWYEATAKRGAACEPLRQNVQADVCVVGAGFSGLTTALELARAGKRVTLLEASRVACGASGRNGGFVSNGFALGLGEIEKHVGYENAKSLFQLSALGTQFVRRTIEQHDSTILMGQGLRLCVRYDDGGGLHKYGRDLQSRFGQDIEFSSTTQTRSVLKSQRYFDSISFPNAFHIHPLKYALILSRLCREAGVSIFENTAARRIVRRGKDFCVVTDAGQVNAEHVVHCVSALDRKLHAPSGRAVLPVATYIAVTEPLKQNSIATSEAIADTRRAGDYYRLLGDGRILWGGRITTRVSEPDQLALAMRGDMLSTFPTLGTPRMDYAWAGLMGYALHKMPLIGRDAEGQWFATAFGGHGLNTTAMAGQLIASAIAGGDDRYRQFTPFAPRWAFGQLGRLGVQGSYWLMQAKDRLDEALKKPVQQ